MTDLSRILDDVFADLGNEKEASLPTLPTSLPTSRDTQPTDSVCTSHTSHSSHFDNSKSGRNDDSAPSNTLVSPDSARVTSSCAGAVGSVGSVGRGAKTRAGSTLPPFPEDFEVVGSVGSGSATCGRPFLDLNHAALQQSCRGAGTAMAEADRLALSPGAPLPITPADVRAGMARELRALAEDGREGPAALRDAIEITRAKIRNSEVLAERQVNGSRCHVCDETLNDDRPVVAVLTGKRGSHLHMHDACHEEHRGRRVALVDRIMTAVGYGPAQTDGAAA